MSFGRAKRKAQQKANRLAEEQLRKEEIEARRIEEIRRQEEIKMQIQTDITSRDTALSTSINTQGLFARRIVSQG